MINKEPVRYLFKRFWQFARQERRTICLYGVLFTLANLVLLLAPLLFGRLLDEVGQRGVSSENLGYIYLLLLLLFVKELGFWLLHGPARIIERIAAFTIGVRYRKFLLEGVLDLDLSWHNEHDSGDTIDKVRRAADNLTEFGENIFRVFQILVRVISTTAVLLVFSKLIAALVFVMVVLSLLVFAAFDRKILPRETALNQLNNRAAASFFDALANVTTVKILNIEKAVSRGVMARFAAALPVFRNTAYLNEWKWFVGIILFQLVNILPLGIYLTFAGINGNAVTVGTLATLYLYISELLWVYLDFGNYYDQLYKFRNGVINAEPLEEKICSHIQRQRTPAPDYKEVEVRNLTFAYEGAQSGFNQLNLTIQRGQKIALIGESGSGKTTFLKLIHGMYANSSASLAFDGVDSHESLHGINLNTMLVPQDPELFSSSIEENLTLGIEYSPAEIQAALDTARFTGVVATLPRGLASVVNEKGVNLSGGQRQRLALARAILFAKDKDMLLLDESTSSVDPENERAIYQAILQQFSDKSVIAAVHKMHLLKYFDLIILFENCRIVDDGSIGELLERNKGFRENWEHMHEDFLQNL